MESDNSNELFVDPIIKEKGEVVVGNQLYSQNSRLSVMVQDLSSSNYQPDAQGWIIRSNGDAEFSSLKIPKGGDLTLEQDIASQSEIIFHSQENNEDMYRIYAELNDGDLVIAPSVSASGVFYMGKTNHFNGIYAQAEDEVVLQATEIYCKGQTFVSTNVTASANNSAIFEVQSTTQGVRFPNMTSTQRDNISSPALGLVIYNTTTNKLNVYTGSWEAITSS